MGGHPFFIKHFFIVSLSSSVFCHLFISTPCTCFFSTAIFNYSSSSSFNDAAKRWKFATEQEIYGSQISKECIFVAALADDGRRRGNFLCATTPSEMEQKPIQCHIHYTRALNETLWKSIIFLLFCTFF
mgnify:CR=1 FL=1